MITSKGTAFKAKSNPSYDEILKSLGWRFLNSLQQWTTTDITKVVPVIEHCDKSTAATVDAWLNARTAAVAASMAAGADIEVPAPQGLAYRNYQKAGIAFMRARKYSLNADAPRLGKTIQSLGLVNSYNRPARVLVICPANAKINWCREAKRWLVHQGTIGYCEGDENPDTDFLAINFQILGRHLNSIGSRQWDFIFVDEAHFLGNPKSQRTQQVMSLDAELHMVFLTGTPVYTRPIQLWPMLQRLDHQGLGSNFWRYVKRYCNAERDENGRWKYDSSSNEEELQFKLRERFMIRREKSDVSAELPTSRITVALPKTGLDRLLKKEKDLVSKNLGDLMDRLKGEMTDAEWTELAKFDGRDDLFTGPVASVRRDIALAKVPMVTEFVEELLLSERKVVVFTHHRDVTQALSAAFTPYGVATVIGGISSAKREAERIRFQEDPACRVFVGNITAAGSAIELSAADVIVFAELSWVPSEIDQAEERIWLPTKTVPLTIYRLVIEDSVESVIAAVLEARQESITRMMTAKHIQNIKTEP